MKITNVANFLEKLAVQASKKTAAADELIVIEWTAGGALLLHLDTGSSPKIKRFSKARFDEAMTEAEKRNAFVQFLSSIPGKHKPKAVLCWSDGMTYRQMSLPSMPEEDLLKALEWDLKKKFYFIPEENIFGFQEVMTVEGDEGPEKLYNVFYCENRTALARLGLVSGLGLEVRAVIPGQVALAYFAALTDPLPDKDTLVCELAGGTARILVTRGERNMLVRNVTLGGAEGALGEGELTRVAEEMRKTIDYYEAQKHSRPIGRAVITGELCESTRALDLLTAKLPIPVSAPTLGNFFSGALEAADRELVSSQSCAFAAALGSALAAEGTLSLVPSEIKTRNRRQKMDSRLNLGLIGFSCVLALALGVTALGTNWTKGRLKTLDEERLRIEETQNTIRAVLEREKARRTAFGGDIPLWALLKDISLRAPSSLALRDLKYSRQEGTLTLSGEVTASSRDSSKALAQFSAQLSESPFLQSVEPANSSVDEENRLLQFDMTASVKGVV